MGTFRESDEGFKSATKEKLDFVALNKAGLMGGLSMGYTIHDNIDNIVRHGYRAKWINTQGNGNCGDLVLIGVSHEAKELLRQGKIKKLMDETGEEYYICDAYMSASQGVQYSLEPVVYQYCLANYDAVEAWKHAAKNRHGSHGQRMGWEKDWSMPEFKGSYWRWMSVLGVMGNWRYGQ